MLSSQLIGKGLPAEIADLKRREAESEHRLEVRASEVGRRAKQLWPGQFEQGALLLERGALVDPIVVASLSQCAQLGPGAGLQLDLVEAQLASEVGDETKIAYAVDATLTGKLGSLGQPVLRAKSREMEKQFAARLQAAFDQPKAEAVR